MKKLLAFVFVAMLVLGMAVTAFAACEHEFLAMRNMTSHYEECQKCFELRNAGSHTFENGKCTVCDYEEPIINPFTDVPNDAWYAADVLSAVATGLITGKTTDKYAPNDNLTYAEAVKLAACMNEKYTKGEVTLEIGAPWYQTYVDYCKNNNIIRTEYNWNDFATRVGYMYIFAYALPEEAYEPINTIEDGTIPDVPMDSPYADIVYKLYRAGIVTGVDAQHNCNPTANITRAEVAVIVARMMDPSKRISFEMKHVYDSVLDDGSDIEIGGDPAIVVGGGDQVDYDVNTGDFVLDDTKLPLKITADPESYEAEDYGEKAELKVVTDGGKPYFTYEWYYNAYRNEKVKIENGDFVSGADTDTLTILVEKDNTLLGSKIFCKVTDANGVEVTSNSASVYGLFSMSAEDVTVVTATKEYTVVGTVADGVLRKGDKISVEMNGKIISIGTVKDIQMFNKSLDEAVKGDRVGVTFELTDGVRPQSGSIVIKYNDAHVIDTSDIVN
ncbi:MAG: S-layer homology domain-containing protein [Clostridia bacterium]|nr:S-layer homology domain-containing protein [Clostridia bacterium]